MSLFELLVEHTPGGGLNVVADPVKSTGVLITTYRPMELRYDKGEQLSSTRGGELGKIQVWS